MGIRSITICLDDYPVENIYVSPKNGKRYLTIDEFDKREPDQYEKDIDLCVPQTKEEREAKVKRKYCGNGKWKYRDKPQFQEATSTPASTGNQDDSVDLPF